MMVPEDLARRFNDLYAGLPGQGGSTAGADGWQKAILGLGLLGNALTYAGNPHTAGWRRGIGGAIGALSDGLGATTRQLQGTPSGQRILQMMGYVDRRERPNRTREWMLANAPLLEIEPGVIDAMDASELARSWWEAMRRREPQRQPPPSIP